MFIAPNVQKKVYSMRFTFHCTNNIMKYKELYQELNIARKEPQIHNLVCYGDEKLIVK